ncbi:MAG TPA: hemerythrin domain-containing protein [Candidatus Binatia bacterium]|jgi:hemerythrin-like domain-containing protein
MPMPLSTRRRFLLLAGSTGAVVVAAALPAQARNDKVSPAEDLMREHGVLKRILLIYDEVARRIDAKQEFPARAVVESADLVRRFVEDYHEKLEENFLFPAFEKAGILTDLVAELRRQHEAGRRVTDDVRTLAKGSAADRPTLARSLRQFVRMYAPHEAREDTVLFPAMHRVFSSRQYDALGERFEDQEEKLFGRGGFESIVGHVGDIEEALGIYDLAEFTPKV